MRIRLVDFCGNLIQLLSSEGLETFVKLAKGGPVLVDPPSDRLAVGPAIRHRLRHVAARYADLTTRDVTY